MDEHDAFERLLAREVRIAYGPERPVDAAAIVRTASTATSALRVRPLVSPGRIALAGAFVVLVAVGFAILGQRLDRSSDVAPAAVSGPTGMPLPSTRSTAARPPTPVNGTFTATAVGTCDGPGGARDGVLHEGLGCTWESDWNDPRLDGRLRFEATMDRYLEGSGLIVWSYRITIENGQGGTENGQGGWDMEPLRWVDFPGAAELDTDVWVLEGRGAYEGLVTVLRSEGPRMLASVAFTVPIEGSPDLRSPVPMDDLPTISSRGYIVDARDVWGAVPPDRTTDSRPAPPPT